tara:strand:+ start:221 stop:478 length:258 start_codon:yes stop_codon:yes gene_type:complete
MARYGANELFNPGTRRKKKKAGIATGSSSGSLGPMAHSQAPDALGMMTKGLAFDEQLKKLMEDDDSSSSSSKSGPIVSKLKEWFS